MSVINRHTILSSDYLVLLSDKMAIFICQFSYNTYLVKKKANAGTVLCNLKKNFKKLTTAFYLQNK